MITVLLRLYPSRWRDRYGDEFAAVLEDQPDAYANPLGEALP